MVAKPVATPFQKKVLVSLDFLWVRRQLCWGQAGEVMATGFEI